MRDALTAAAAGENIQSVPIERDIPTLGPRRVTVNARGFELDDEKPLILVALEIANAEEAS